MGKWKGVTAENYRVVRLDWSSYTTYGRRAENILHGCELSSIPRELGGLKRMVWLNVGSNEFPK